MANDLEQWLSTLSPQEAERIRGQYAEMAKNTIPVDQQPQLHSSTPEAYADAKRQSEARYANRGIGERVAESPTGQQLLGAIRGYIEPAGVRIEPNLEVDFYNPFKSYPIGSKEAGYGESMAPDTRRFPQSEYQKDTLGAGMAASLVGPGGIKSAVKGSKEALNSMRTIGPDMLKLKGLLNKKTLQRVADLPEEISKSRPFVDELFKGGAAAREAASAGKRGIDSAEMVGKAASTAEDTLSALGQGTKKAGLVSRAAGAVVDNPMATKLAAAPFAGMVGESEDQIDGEMRKEAQQRQLTAQTAAVDPISQSAPADDMSAVEDPHIQELLSRADAILSGGSGAAVAPQETPAGRYPPTRPKPGISEILAQRQPLQRPEKPKEGFWSRVARSSDPLRYAENDRRQEQHDLLMQTLTRDDLPIEQKYQIQQLLDQQNADQAVDLERRKTEGRLDLEEARSKRPGAARGRGTLDQMMLSHPELFSPEAISEVLGTQIDPRAHSRLGQRQPSEMQQLTALLLRNDPQIKQLLEQQAAEQAAATDPDTAIKSKSGLVIPQR